MKIWLSTIGAGKISGQLGTLVEEFLKRSGRFQVVEQRRFAGEAGLLSSLSGKGGRTQPVLVLADSRGEMVSSEELAEKIRRYRDGGVQELVMSIGPADGWSEAAIKRADLVVSFGRITLPHELAAVVAAEQLYRASTILAGHPYHKGH